MEETTSNPCPHCGYLSKNSPDYALQSGTILHGRYLLGRILGQGGFGITYIGWDLALNRKVAIKEYYPSSCVSRDVSADASLQWFPTQESQEARTAGKEAFLKEARKLNLVDSIPQVVHALELFEDNGTAYLVMNYIPGETLHQRVKKSGTFSWKALQETLLPVADILVKVHNAGLLHRDLSPDNLIIQPDGSVRILDLGAAKDIRLQKGTSSMQIATAGFSPLEQYVQKYKSGPWTDVYSMAATIYYALTGVVPPSALDRLSKDTLRWDLPSLRGVPVSVIRVLQKAMAIHVKDRTQSMSDFAADLRKASTVRKSKKMLPVLIAAGLILVIALLVAFRKDFGAKPFESASAAVSQESAENPEEAPWAGNVLQSGNLSDAYATNPAYAPVFQSRITRQQIVSVTFLDSLETAGDNSWDVSEARDGSVLAWTIPNGTDGTMENYDLYIAAEGGINGKYCISLFEGYQNLENVFFKGNFHTDQAKSMQNMFFGCRSLKTLDVSYLKTGNVRSMESMFANCAAEQLDFSTWDTSQVESMANMFYYCSNLKYLDLRTFDTSKVTTMSSMFNMATSLQNVELGGWDTGSVTHMDFLFSDTEVSTLDLSHFDMSHVTKISYMFYNCKSLKRLDSSGWDTGSVEYMDNVFLGCESLETVAGISDWDTSSVTSHRNFMDEGILIDHEPWENMFQ